MSVITINQTTKKYNRREKMKKTELQIAIALVALAGATQLAKADLIPYGNVGTPNPVTYTFTAAASADVIAYFAGSSAAYDEQLGMLDNGVLTSAGFGLDDHTSFLGQSFDLGHVTAGDTLTFVLDVTSPNLGYVYSDPSLNTAYDINGSDGHNHVYSTPYTGGGPIIDSIPVGTYVAFEDLPFPDSDFNYFDETYVFTDIAVTSTVPEPTTMLAGALLLLPFGANTLRILRKNRAA